jgi:hypothetical protein
MCKTSLNVWVKSQLVDYAIQLNYLEHIENTSLWFNLNKFYQSKSTFVDKTVTRFISNKTVVHFDLICLISYFTLNFDQFAWSLRPYLPDHSFPVTFRPLCVMTYSNTKQTAWSVRVRVATNLPDHFDLICLISYSLLPFGRFVW